MSMVDDQVLRKLAAAADHETGVAIAARDAVDRAQVKVARAKAAVGAAEDALAEAATQAEEAELRADTAVQDYRDAVDGADFTANAGTAEGSGKA